MSKKEEASYKGILKSTSIVGGAQVFQIIIGVLRNKVIAILLGTTGVGLIGLYQSILDMSRNLSSMGINMSGVRDVAEAQKCGNQENVAKTIVILNRWSWATGFLGLLLLLVFCIPASQYSFGNKAYALNIAILSVSSLLTNVGQAQFTIIQGLQLYKNIAIANLLISITSLILTVPLFYILGQNGIVPSLILAPAIALTISLRFIPKLKYNHSSISFKETFNSGLRMVKLGAFMVVNGFLATGTLLLTRSYLSTRCGIETVGLFQASWMIANNYIGIVLNAMLVDFFPRLSANNNDDKSMNRLTNEQCEITLILGAPLLILLMAFAPLVVKLLYSDAFNGSVILLQWFVAGSFVLLISWPVGVIFLAKGKGLYSVILDLTGSMCFLLIGFISWHRFGLTGFGISNFIRAVLAIIVVLILGKKASGFTYSKEYLKLVVLYSVPFICCFVISLRQVAFADVINIVLSIFVIAVSVKMLHEKVGLNVVLSKLYKLKSKANPA